MANRIRFLFFDLDETLIPDEPAMEGALTETCEPVRRLGLDPARLGAEVHQAARRIFRSFPEGYTYAERIGISAREGLWGRFEGSPDPGLLTLHRFLPNFRLQSWKEGLASMGVNDDALAGELSEAFPRVRRQPQYCRPYPDAIALLNALKGRCRMAVITNGAPDLQREKLLASGLAGYFDAAVVSGEIGVGKPEKEIFETAMKNIGAAAEQSVMIGDNPARDVEGGRRAGMRTILINRLGKYLPSIPSPDLAVQDLSPLPEWLGL